MNVQETLRFLDAVKETAVSGLSDPKRSLTQKKKIDHLIRLADRCREFLAVNTGPKHVMVYDIILRYPGCGSGGGSCCYIYGIEA